LDAEATGNRRVSYQQVDLSDWQSVRCLTRNVINTEDRLDVLINNAGNIRCRSQKFEAVQIKKQPVLAVSDLIKRIVEMLKNENFSRRIQFCTFTCVKVKLKFRFW